MCHVIRRKLIEVALPLDAINEASVRENYIYRGNPSAIHKWWAQRPLAAARAVIFAQMVDDPSSHPDIFRTEKAQEKERQRLFRIIEELVTWENTTNEEVLARARVEIWQSWRAACADYGDHPRATELFDRYKLPSFHDPFVGAGMLPLEAQRLGLNSYSSDLNPVAALIAKALIEIPPKFAGKPPVNPSTREEKTLAARQWRAAEGLAEDVRYYGKWMRDEAEKRIGHLYPEIEVTADLARERADLKPFVGRRLPVIAWLWARTVKSPNPAFAQVDVPLASTFMLSTKERKEVYVEPILSDRGYQFVVKIGKPEDETAAKRGTRSGSSGSSFLCLMSGTPMPFDYLRCEAKAGRMGERLMACVTEGERGRLYFSPTPEMEEIARRAEPGDVPETELPSKALGFRVQEYGMTRWRDLFNSRQLVALEAFSDLVQKDRKQTECDAIAADWPYNDQGLDQGGTGVQAYSDAVATLLAFSVDKMAEYGCTIVPWYAKEDRPKGLFARQAIPMVWDFAEVNPLGDIGGAFLPSVKIVAGALGGCPVSQATARVEQLDAVADRIEPASVVSTDPPYYDNIGYADLSDFFYVWLRRSLKSIFPNLFSTVAVPKNQELVATPYRHGTRQAAEQFFMDGMTRAMHRLSEVSHPAFPVTIYYAFKQSENDGEAGTASTGWETFLDAVIRAGFTLTGTWPMRTERTARSVAKNTNALASSIVLVCRPRAADAPTVTRRDFLNALEAELPDALKHLQHGNIAPVDLAQAAIGPGMAVYSRYATVLEADGKPLSVREALAVINQTLDEVLTEQEGDFDADSRWALAWFEQLGFTDGEYGVGETLSKAKNTSISGMVDTKIVVSKAGKVRLVKPDELSPGWDPTGHRRLTAWEIVHQLIRALEGGGESAAARLVAQLGTRAEIARELAYRLYTVCERKKRAAEALSYNGLVQSWPEITRLAREERPVQVEQAELFAER